MKRYALFAGNVFYPHGGFDDLWGAYDDLASAVAEGERYMRDTQDYGNGLWVQVVDLSEGVVVKDCDSEAKMAK